MRTPVLRSPAVLLGVPAVAVAALGVGSMVGGFTPTADHSADPGRSDAAATQRVPGAQAAPPVVQAVPAAMPVVPPAPSAGVSTLDAGTAHSGGGTVEAVSSTGDDAVAPSGVRMLTFDRGAAAPQARPVAHSTAAPVSTAGGSGAAASRTTPAVAPVARHAAAPAAAADSSPDDTGTGGALLTVSTPVAGLSVLSFG